MRSLLLMAAFPALALAGCGNKADDAPKTETTSSTTAPADTTPEQGFNVAALWGGGKPQAIDVQKQHPNGVVLQLTSVQAKPTETVVRLKVLNGAGNDVDLNWSDKSTFLTAAGQKFFVQPPVENTKLTVAKGQSMEGELVFLGRVPKDTPLTLVINDGMSSDNRFSSNPNMVVELPVTAAAFSDDGSKKN